MSAFIRTLFASAVLLLAVPAVFAAPDFDPTFFDQGESHGHPWLSGGIGADQRATLSQLLGTDYNLKLEFAVAEGNYLGAVDVAVLTPRGEAVLTVHSPGPWLLTRLPPGSYRVRVSGYGKSFEQALTLPAQGARTLIFSRWTTAEVDAFAPE